MPPTSGHFFAASTPQANGRDPFGHFAVKRNVLKWVIYLKKVYDCHRLGHAKAASERGKIAHSSL